MVVFHPFPPCHSFLLITPICCSASETRVGAQDGCVWWRSGLCRSCSRLQPSRSRCAWPERSSSRLGGHPPCCRSMGERFATCWAAPGVSANQSKLMTVPLRPGEDEGSIFPVLDTLSSKQSSGSDGQNVHKGHSCCLFCKKNLD